MRMYEGRVCACVYDIERGREGGERERERERESIRFHSKEVQLSCFTCLGHQVEIFLHLCQWLETLKSSCSALHHQLVNIRPLLYYTSTQCQSTKRVRFVIICQLLTNYLIAVTIFDCLPVNTTVSRGQCSIALCPDHPSRWNRVPALWSILIPEVLSALCPGGPCRETDWI